MRRYLVVIEKTETGYSSYAPDLPGCMATGSTRDEVEQNIFEALQFHLDGMREEGIEIPEAFAESEILVIQ
ncbi:MAG: type II toxin-antitoxin system HicB family antitoxin [Spirochaetales bacterium]|nr:type II toxin-antitoxin system HicB family antitoxin [Spirochaetales bacterium]